ncbi:MAG: hypothetical protein JWM84_1391 [Nocardioides sp.]|jgi:hypothetical protein|nr:hypothetical protein [Nocardioides sp.]
MTESPQHHDTLSLSRLREYRARLREEEDRISYWRRVVHARLDLLRAGSDTAASLSRAQLERALGDTATGHRRAALLKVRAFDPLPELPVLAEVWDVVGDEAFARLEAASEQLSEYRSALHARIDAATAVLIARYRENPSLALEVLA